MATRRLALRRQLPEHSLQDCLQAIIEALGRLVDIDVQTLPDAVQATSTAPSYATLNGALHFIEPLRVHLNVRHHSGIANEVDERLKKLVERLRAWEATARVDSPARYRTDGSTSTFSEAVCNEFDDICDEAIRFSDYLESVLGLIGIVDSHKSPVEPREVTPPLSFQIVKSESAHDAVRLAVLILSDLQRVVVGGGVPSLQRCKDLARQCCVVDKFLEDRSLIEKLGTANRNTPVAYLIYSGASWVSLIRHIMEDWRQTFTNEGLKACEGRVLNIADMEMSEFKTFWPSLVVAWSKKPRILFQRLSSEIDTEEQRLKEVEIRLANDGRTTMAGNSAIASTPKLSGEEQGQLVSIFSLGVSIGEKVAALRNVPDGEIDSDTYNRVVTIGHEIKDEHRQLANQLQELKPSKFQNWPPDVVRELQTVASIVKGARSGPIGYGDAALFLARSKILDASIRGWSAVSRDKNSGFLPWALSDHFESPAAPTAATVPDNATRSHAPSMDDGFAIYRDGTGFFVSGFGESGYFDYVKGFEQIQRLVRTPKVPVAMVELHGDKNDDPHSVQPVVDRDWLEAVREEMKGHTRDRDEAERFGDQESKRKAEEEIARLETHAKNAVGLRGKARDMNNPNNSRRASIGANLKRAYRKLRQSSPPMNNLADHWEAGIAPEGGISFMYSPGGLTVNWITEKPI